MESLYVFRLFLVYAVLPGVIISFAVSLLAAAAAALFFKFSGGFLPTFVRIFVGGVLTSAIAGGGGMAFVFFNAYILDDAAYQGQGMAYAMLLVPVLSVVGAAIGGIGAIALTKRSFSR